MRDPEWVALTDSQRGQLVAIWLLAADRDGVIPASPDVIKKLCFMDSAPNLKILEVHGFIELPGHVDANMTPDRRQHDQPDKSRDRVETEYIVPPKFDFEALWLRYPKKDGRRAAERHFRASVVNVEDWGRIQKALLNYLKHVAGKEAQFIKNGSTWFNNWADWVDWEGDKNGPRKQSSDLDRLFEREDQQKSEQSKLGEVPKLFR